MGHMHRCITSIAVLCLAAACLQAQGVFDDPGGNYTVVVPAPFVKSAKPRPQGCVALFEAPARPGEIIPMLLSVQPMHGVIGREIPADADLRSLMDGMRSQVPPGAKVDLPQVSMHRWNGFDIVVVETRASGPSGSVVVFLAHIPLRKEALQLSLLAPGGARDRAAMYLDQAIKGVRGETNWTAVTANGPADPLARKQYLALSEKQYLIVLLAVMVVVFLGIMVGLWLLSRVSPKGVVLALAVVTWLVGRWLGQHNVRELQGLSGAVTMAGFGGILLGIADLFRKREPKAPDGTAPPPLPPQAQHGPTSPREAENDRQ